MAEIIMLKAITPETVMPGTGLVLARTPGYDRWTEARYTVGPDGFELKDLQRMAGGGFYESIRLDDTFTIICNEDGRTLKLPVSVAIALPKGGELSIFGPCAVVRIRPSSPQRQRAYIGLRDGDAQHIMSAYSWLTGPR